MSLQELLGLITVVMAIGLHIPYLLGAIKGTIRPHPFTWILWTILTFIVFFAQVSQQAGPGAWGTGVVAFLCVAIVGAALKNGFSNIQQSDVVLFSLALLAIPLWFVTEDPTMSVILVTVIDLIAFLPTFRKVWAKPFEEALYLYGLNVLRHLISLFALVKFSIATALFPFALILTNGALALFIVWRRGVLK